MYLLNTRKAHTKPYYISGVLSDHRENAARGRTLWGEETGGLLCRDGWLETQSCLKLKKWEISAGKSKRRLYLNDLVTAEGTSAYLTSKENNGFRYFLGYCMSPVSGQMRAKKGQGGMWAAEGCHKEVQSVQSLGNWGISIPHALPSKFPGGSNWC